MISCFKYSNKKVKNTSLRNINFLRDSVWIDVLNPKKDEIKQLIKIGIHQDHINDVLNVSSVPRAENTKKYSFMLVRGVLKEHTTPIGVFVGRNFIITVHMNKSGSIDKLLDTVRTGNNTEYFKKIGYFAYVILADIRRGYNQKILEINDKIEKLENKAFNPKAILNPNELLGSKRTLLFYKRALIKNKDVIEDITEKNTTFIAQVYLSNFEILEREFSEVVNTVDLSLERIKGVMEISMSNEANKLNDIMKRFTIIASLLLLPMLISGIWGMNFANIPFYSLKHGFFIPIIFMIVSAVIMYTVFRIKRWT